MGAHIFGHNSSLEPRRTQKRKLRFLILNFAMLLQRPLARIELAGPGFWLKVGSVHVTRDDLKGHLSASHCSRSPLKRPWHAIRTRRQRRPPPNPCRSQRQKRERLRLRKRSRRKLLSRLRNPVLPARTAHLRLLRGRYAVACI